MSEASIRNLLSSCPSLKSLKLSHLRLSSLTTWHLSAYAKRLDSLDLSHRYRGPPCGRWHARRRSLTGGCAAGARRVALRWPSMQ